VTTLDGFKKMEEGFDFGQAVAEANRCLLCHDAPCSVGCPGGTDPGTFIRKLKMRNITGAIRTIKQNNILGASCGVLCPTAALCEKECCATGIDRPIQIGKLQRFLIEHARQMNINPLEAGEPCEQRVAVVGSGPAGLSCAAELAKEGYRVTIFEARAEPGGVLRYGVPNFRLSTEFFQKEIDDIKALGVDIICSSPIKGPGAAENLLTEGFSAVFLAPGLWTSATWRGEQQEPSGLFSAVDFLSTLREERFEEMGKSIKDKKVAVIGGGSVAMDCAESCVKLGAKDTYLIYRRSYTQMPAEADENQAALNAGIHYLLLNQPVDYVTDAEGRLKAITLRRTELGEQDDSGRRRPIEIEGSDWDFEVDAVIEAIGSKAEDDSPAWYPSVKVTRKNLIEAHAETGATSVKGIFAGGDIVHGPALVIEAVRDGKASAKAISTYLKEVSS